MSVFIKGYNPWVFANYNNATCSVVDSNPRSLSQSNNNIFISSTGRSGEITTSNTGIKYITYGDQGTGLTYSVANTCPKEALGVAAIDRDNQVLLRAPNIYNALSDIDNKPFTTIFNPFSSWPVLAGKTWKKIVLGRGLLLAITTTGEMWSIANDIYAVGGNRSTNSSYLCGLSISYRRSNATTVFGNTGPALANRSYRQFDDYNNNVSPYINVPDFYSPQKIERYYQTDISIGTNNFITVNSVLNAAFGLPNCSGGSWAFSHPPTYAKILSHYDAKYIFYHNNVHSDGRTNYNSPGDNSHRYWTGSAWGCLPASSASWLTGLILKGRVDTIWDDIYVVNDTVFAIDSTNKVYVWGYGGNLNAGAGITATWTDGPLRNTTLDAYNGLRNIDGLRNGYLSWGITGNGTILLWGLGTSNSNIQISLPTPVKKILSWNNDHGNGVQFVVLHTNNTIGIVWNLIQPTNGLVYNSNFQYRTLNSSLFDNKTILDITFAQSISGNIPSIYAIDSIGRSYLVSQISTTNQDIELLPNQYSTTDTFSRQVSFANIPGILDELTSSNVLGRAVPVNVFSSSFSIMATPTPTNTTTPSNTPTQTQTSTSSQTPTSSQTRTPSQTGTPSQTPTQTITPTNTTTQTNTTTPTNTITQTSSRTPSITPSQTPTNSATPTITPTNSKTPSQTPTQTSTETPTQTPTQTQTRTQTPTISNSQTPTPSISKSATPTPTISNSATPTQTPTISNSATPTVSQSSTPTPTVSDSQTPTPTASSTLTPFLSATPTPTTTPTSTETPTPTPTTTETPTVTPTTTATPTNTITNTVTRTATTTPTKTPTTTPTNTPTTTITPSQTLTKTPTGTIPTGENLYFWGKNVNTDKTGNTYKLIPDTRALVQYAQQPRIESLLENLSFSKILALSIGENLSLSFGISSPRGFLYGWGGSDDPDTDIYTENMYPKLIRALIEGPIEDINYGQVGSSNNYVLYFLVRSGLNNIIYELPIGNNSSSLGKEATIDAMALSPIKTVATLRDGGLANRKIHCLINKNNRYLREIITNVPTSIGTIPNTTQPILISSIGFGQNHTMAIREDGTLWAKGINESRFGDNNAIASSLNFIKVGVDNNWSKLVVGHNHTLAIRKDGSLWAWGFNNQGQLGCNDYTNRDIPVNIPGDWKEVYVFDGNIGQNISYGIQGDGSVWYWGAGIGNSPRLLDNSYDYESFSFSARSFDPTQTPTNSNTPSNTPTNTQTPTSTSTATPTQTPSNTATNSQTPTTTPTNTPTNSETPTNTPTNSVTPSNTPTISNSQTTTPTNSTSPTPTPTNTVTPGLTATATETPTPTPSQTPTNSETPTNTVTPSNTPTNSETPTNTPTNTATPSQTPTNTPTNTKTPTYTPTQTITPSNTRTPTPSPRVIEKLILSQITRSAVLGVSNKQSFAQSFIAPQSGRLSKIEVEFVGSYTGQGIVEVYEGSIDSILMKDPLYSATVSVNANNNFNLTSWVVPSGIDLFLSQGISYTFKFIPISDMPEVYGLVISTKDKYNGGLFCSFDETNIVAISKLESGTNVSISIDPTTDFASITNLVFNNISSSSYSIIKSITHQDMMDHIGLQTDGLSETNVLNSYDIYTTDNILTTPVIATISINTSITEEEFNGLRVGYINDFGLLYDITSSRDYNTKTINASMPRTGKIVILPISEGITPTPTVSSSSTPTITPTQTPSATPTYTPTNTVTPGLTATASETPTQTPTST